MGTECLYLSQAELAQQVASAIASVGFKNRGAKKRTDLYFLNKTDMPAILVEVCFVDSQADADLYDEQFDRVCSVIAGAIAGDETDTQAAARTAGATRRGAGAGSEWEGFALRRAG